MCGGKEKPIRDGRDASDREGTPSVFPDPVMLTRTLFLSLSRPLSLLFSQSHPIRMPRQ